MKLLQAIEEVRGIRGLSYEELALQAGMSTATLWRLLHGKTRISLDAAANLCKVLDLHWPLGNIETKQDAVVSKPTISELEEFLERMSLLDEKDIDFIITFVDEKARQNNMGIKKRKRESTNRE